SSSIAAGWLPYTFGLHGPCVSYDTACSSALAASHAGLRALQLAECNVGLVMGVDTACSSALVLVRGAAMDIEGDLMIRLSKRNALSDLALAVSQVLLSSLVALALSRVHRGLGAFAAANSSYLNNEVTIGTTGPLDTTCPWPDRAQPLASAHAAAGERAQPLASVHSPWRERAHATLR
ncbi:hypothetical protein OAO87_02330, partial [bacterium]|nr:hypothetical protein [bacterium]